MDSPRGIKLHQHSVFAFHERVVVAVGEDQHPILFFHLRASFISLPLFLLILIVTVFFLSILLLLLCNI